MVDETQRTALPRFDTLAPEVANRLEKELLRINMRYIEEFIEGHNICPFSRCGRCVGAVGRRLYTHEVTDPLEELSEAFLKTLDKVALNPKIEVMLCIFPWSRLDARSWRKFTENVRLSVNKRHGEAIYAAAAFHPDLPYGDDNPDRAVAFFRHSPDPVVQLVRLDTLERAGAGTRETTLASAELIKTILAGNMPPAAPRTITEIVTDDNFAMMHRLGIQKLQAQLDDIYADREQSVVRVLAGEDIRTERGVERAQFCSIPMSDDVRKKIEAQGMACRREAAEKEAAEKEAASS